MRNNRWLIAALIVTAITALVLVEPGRYLTLDYLKSERAVLEAYVAATRCVRRSSVSAYTLPPLRFPCPARSS